MFIRSLLLLLCSELAFAAAAPSFPVLKYSTYLRDNFTPNAIATDAAGNIYLAGAAIVDPSTSQTTALVVKLNPQASQYLYVRYFGGSLYDSATAIAVDSAGNAYIAGSTASPDFPVSSGGNLATAPAGLTSQRSFVVKLDPNGELIFSDLLGGSASSQAQAVAVNTTGQILVTGTSATSGFPSTTGAYNISNTANHPFLLELDPTGTKIVFSATGIGGSALALDSSGNIYVAGTTYLLDYPTTPGAYQSTFPVFTTCFAPCQLSFQGPNQYVTKVDPIGSKLIFSTSVSGQNNTTNTGLAVDSAGDVYLTGLEGGLYPFTVTPPAQAAVNAFPGIATALPFLSKLDPAGQKLLFSVPVGGGSVIVDSNGSAYVGGMVGLAQALDYYILPTIPALASVPGACLPNTTYTSFIQRSAYVSQVDAATGNLLGTQFIGGSSIAISGVALSGATLWLAGGTNLPDFPFSPDALTLPYIGPGPLPGAYLGAVDFSQPQPPAGTPQIGCIVDAADFALAGVVAPLQLFTIFGTGLDPSAGASVAVSFGSTPAPLLYASSTQINFAVPAGVTSSSAMQLTVNGLSSPQRLFPLTSANPSLFLNLADTDQSGQTYFIDLALNSDGSINSVSNPARTGSIITVFLNGISASPLAFTSNNGWFVTGASQLNPYVVQVSLQIPPDLVGNFDCSTSPSVCVETFTINYPNPGPGTNGPQSASINGLQVGGAVYVTETDVSSHATRKLFRGR